MATIIRVAGADFSANAVGFLPPVSSGLLGWYFPGGTTAKTAKNLAPGGVTPSLVNAPAISAAYASFGGASQSGAAYIQTNIPESANMTLMVASRALGDITISGQRPHFIGPYNFGTAPRGFGINVGGSASVQTDAGYLQADGTTKVQQLATVTGFAANSWRFLAGMAGNASPRKLVDKTQNVTTSTANTLARDVNTLSLDTRIGTSTAGLFGLNDCAFAAVYNRVLTDAEIETVYQFVKAYLAARSITI